MKLSQHFDSSEFICKCGCGESKTTPELIALLESIRTALGNRAIAVTPKGGYRCPIQNAKSGGADRSQHLKGNAADIQVAGLNARQVQTRLRDLHRSGKLFIGGMGSYKTFTHVDARKVVTRW